MRVKSVVPVALAAVAVGLAVPAMSSGHATISAVQPQGALLTSARTAYVVRVPVERAKQNTWKAVMFVPAALQERISVRKVPGWTIRLSKAPTGVKDADGYDVQKITRISWTANSKADETEPSMYEEFPVRFQNPATAQSVCFGINQYYRNKDGSRRKPEIVGWNGPPTSATPASCLTFVDKAPGT